MPDPQFHGTRFLRTDASLPSRDQATASRPGLPKFRAKPMNRVLAHFLASCLTVLSAPDRRGRHRRKARHGRRLQNAVDAQGVERVD